jgi:glucosamine--fructose-6-phosphate aminotransferase (isomerizing)
VIVGIRKETPLVVGLGQGENFLASAVSAFLSETRTVIFPEDGDVVVVTRDGVEITSLDGVPVEREVQTVDWDDEAAEKAGYETFMLKEIHEQPGALADTLAERVGADGGVVLDDLGLTAETIQGLRRVIIVACGTSYYAGLVGRYALERWARLPVEVEVASEFRYRDPVVDSDCLCIAISQSGETADTLAAMRLARHMGARVLAVTNIVGSQATREADGVLFTRAGLEIGVAATKTFLTQVMAMLLLALHVGRLRGRLSAEEVRGHTEELRRIPALLSDYLEDGAAAKVEEVACRYSSKNFFMCLGRRTGLPVALEGALKLKEISYVPTEAYAAGEMKHGPIALLEEGSPVLVVATDSTVYDKLISNVQEVIARGAKVIAVASEGNQSLAGMAEDVLYVPRTDEMFAPLLATVPLQLFAYYVAKARGEKVDQPRNLAKTVTVE